jgi:pyridinium-3,5-bisthiocarboxylic acid mononucleotide nickel chelatase
MRLIYFDCFAGASGDMILASMLDAGLEFETLQNELGKLNLHGYSLKTDRTVKQGISAATFEVETGHHHHHHRGLSEILSIIDQSGLSESVKDRSRQIFTRLGQAEAKIHGKSVEEIHFHEVGAVDAIVDIVGACIGFEALKVDEIVASPLHLGRGFVECAHGRLPVPPPAVVELTIGFPVYQTDVEGELVTPTGAAILTTLARFGGMPAFRTEKIGYGAGRRDLAVPNVLRVMLGESQTQSGEDAVQLIETNIDDMNPQFYDHIMETLFTAGARDVFLTPIIMKKQRPGIVLSVLGTPDKIDELTKTIFRETTTLGVRICEIQKRNVAEREIRSVSTVWGEARVKIRKWDGETTVMPEYDDCKRIAKERGLPIHIIWEGLLKEAKNQLKMNS